MCDVVPQSVVIKCVLAHQTMFQAVKSVSNFGASILLQYAHYLTENFMQVSIELQFDSDGFGSHAWTSPCTLAFAAMLR